MDQLPSAARSYFLQGPPGSVASLVIQSPDGRRRQVPVTRAAAPGTPLVPTFY
jgi:hypothetical protein